MAESLHENNTVENMERIFKAAKEFGFEFIPFDTVKSLSCDKSCNFGKAECASVLSAKILEITDWKPDQQSASCAMFDCTISVVALSFNALLRMHEIFHRKSP